MTGTGGKQYVLLEFLTAAGFYSMPCLKSKTGLGERQGRHFAINKWAQISGQKKIVKKQ